MMTFHQHNAVRQSNKPRQLPEASALLLIRTQAPLNSPRYHQRQTFNHLIQYHWFLLIKKASGESETETRPTAAANDRRDAYVDARCQINSEAHTREAEFLRLHLGVPYRFCLSWGCVPRFREHKSWYSRAECWCAIDFLFVSLFTRHFPTHHWRFVNCNPTCCIDFL